MGRGYREGIRPCNADPEKDKYGTNPRVYSESEERQPSRMRAQKEGCATWPKRHRHRDLRGDEARFGQDNDPPSKEKSEEGGKKGI